MVRNKETKNSKVAQKTSSSDAKPNGKSTASTLKNLPLNKKTNSKR